MNNFILEKKKKKVCDIISLLNKSISVIFIDLKNLESNDISLIRRICKKNDCISKVYKKTLFLKSFYSSKFKYKLIKRDMFFSSIIIFSFEHIGYIIRLLNNNQNLLGKIHVNYVLSDYNFNNNNNLTFELSIFPTHNEALLKFLFNIKYISILKFLLILYKIKLVMMGINNGN